MDVDRVDDGDHRFRAFSISAAARLVFLYYSPPQKICVICVICG